MACKTETKQIGEREYSVTQWAAEKSILMKFKLVKALGPSLANLASTLADDDSSEENSEVISNLSSSISLLFESSSPEQLVALMKECLVGVAIDGRRLTENSFNEMFSPDDIIEIYKVFIFVIQVNYSNFIKGQSVKNLLAKVGASV